MSKLKDSMLSENENPKIKITGEWDGQKIWRNKTPEEKLEDVKIKSEEAMTYLALLTNKENKYYGKI